MRMTRLVPSGGGSGDGWTTVVKSVDEARPSHLGSDLDDELATGILATGKKYVVRGRIHFVTNVAAGFVWDFSWGAAADADAGFVRFTEVDRDGPGRVINANGTFGGEQTEANFTHAVLEFEAIVPDGFDDTFEFAWGQVVSDVFATTVKKGSYLEYREIV